MIVPDAAAGRQLADLGDVSYAAKEQQSELS
jgi:hypothetical protein